MNEYDIMAKYYDIFYQNKNYQKETEFIEKIIAPRITILDLGCGTGNHMCLLESKGYVVEGIDLNKSMLDIAKTKVKGTLYEGNIIDYKINKKYDVIISMFAVFNHLRSYEELEKTILHWQNNLNKKGIMIIDLHNGRKSGNKEEIVNNYKRVMEWKFDKNQFKEQTKITYFINNETYYGCHEFKIFEIDKIKSILNKNNLKYSLYENYTFNIANDKSKNIQLVIINE